MRTLLHTCLLLLLSGLALDFRGGGEDGPSVVQYLFLAMSVAGGFGVIVCGLVLSNGQIVSGSSFGSRVLLITLAFCAWAPVALVASSDTAHSDFISVILPYLLYGQSMLAVLIALQNGISERSIIRTMLVVSAISCAWRLVYAVTLGGVELADARWQILSPALPLILGASVAAINSRTNRTLAVTGLVYFLGIVALSITRSYLVALAGVLLATVITTRGRGSALLAPRALGRIAVVVISLLISLTVLLLVLPAEVRERWTGRLSGEKSESGGEITLLIRLAQFKGQYDALTTSGVSLLAGRGFGASFVEDELLLSGLAFIGEGEVVEHTNGSDSTWGYPIFAHGIVLGPLFLGALLMIILSSVRTSRALSVTGAQAFPYFFTCFSLVAYLGISLTGNIFSARLGGVLIGAIVSLSLHQRARVATHNRPSARGRSARPGHQIAKVSLQ